MNAITRSFIYIATSLAAVLALAVHAGAADPATPLRLAQSGGVDVEDDGLRGLAPNEDAQGRAEDRDGADVGADIQAGADTDRDGDIDADDAMIDDDPLDDDEFDIEIGKGIDEDPYGDIDADLGGHADSDELEDEIDGDLDNVDEEYEIEQDLDDEYATE